MRFYRPTLAGLAALFASAFFAPAQGGLLEFLFGPDPAPELQMAPQRAQPDRRRARLQGDLRFAKPKEGLPGGGSSFSTEPAAGGFCVRTCDGYFFPLIKSTRATRQQSCELACPSAPMEIYDGGTIETARNAKGQRYSALPVAFAFRDRANSSCVCNDPRTSQAFFEKTARNDPTLQSGDILVEEKGAFVYRSDKFVPLSNASFMSSTLRDRLRAMLRRTAAKSKPAESANAPTGEISFGKDDRTGSTTR
ncbi:MAG: DUF2865 domain-containing protein [Methylocystis sp.]|jgi:hypothetical protein